MRGPVGLAWPYWLAAAPWRPGLIGCSLTHAPSFLVKGYQLLPGQKVSLGCGADASGRPFELEPLRLLHVRDCGRARCELLHSVATVWLKSVALRAAYIISVTSI
jgi:hypothetical protein